MSGPTRPQPDRLEQLRRVWQNARTSVTDRILADLALHEEGRFEAQLMCRLDGRPGHASGNVHDALKRLVAEGRVWTLPVRRHCGDVLTLYFLPTGTPEDTHDPIP